MKPGEKKTIADIEGSGIINHIWMTANSSFWRKLFLRFYWDNEEGPSGEIPIGDFFVIGGVFRGHKGRAKAADHILTLAVDHYQDYFFWHDEETPVKKFINFNLEIIRTVAQYFI